MYCLIMISKAGPALWLRNKTTSSTKWLHRQKKDPLVRRAAQDQYRCRSAYKLIELNSNYNKLLKRGQVVVDCGASPGAWSQVAAETVGRSGVVVAADIREVGSLPGVCVLSGCDLTSLQGRQRILDILGDKKADLVLSDMAPNSSGIKEMDHQRIIQLARSALQLSQTALGQNGAFVCKLWQGSLTNVFKAELKTCFSTVKESTLKSSRKESSELFICAQNYQRTD